jgi:hypothetical protein
MGNQRERERGDIGNQREGERGDMGEYSYILLVLLGRG